MSRRLAVMGALALTLPFSGLTSPAVAATAAAEGLPTHLQYSKSFLFDKVVGSGAIPVANTSSGNWTESVLTGTTFLFEVFCNPGDPIDHGVAVITADTIAANAVISGQDAFVTNANVSEWRAVVTLPDAGDRVRVTIVCRDDVFTP